MRCRKAHWFLSARCDGTLSERQRLRLEAHLVSCDECRREAFYFSEIAALATRIGTHRVRPDFNLRLRVAIRQADGEAARPTSRVGRMLTLVWSPALVAASILVLGLGGLGAWGLIRTDATPQPTAAEPSVPTDDQSSHSVQPVHLGQPAGELVPVDPQDPAVLRAGKRYLELERLPKTYINGSVGLGASDSQAVNAEFLNPTVTLRQEEKASD